MGHQAGYVWAGLEYALYGPGKGLYGALSWAREWAICIKASPLDHPNAL